MPLSDFRFAAGSLVHRLESGLLYSGFGQIFVAKPDPKGCDENLWAVLKSCADQLHLGLHVNSLTTGLHTPGSRHYLGHAADINHIGPVKSALPQATPDNPHALHLVALLRENGWRTVEGGPWPGLFLGPPHTALNASGVDHSTHLHVSIAAHPTAGASPREEQEPEDFCEPEEGMPVLREKEELGESILRTRLRLSPACTVPPPLRRAAA